MKIGVAYVAYITNEELMQLARETLASITSEQHKLVFEGWLNHEIAPEYRKELERYGKVYDNDENCLARGWNRGIESLLAKGCDYVFAPNLDIVLRPDSLDTLVAGAESRPDFLLWTMAVRPDMEALLEGPTEDVWQPYPHFSAFMVNERTVETVGQFDENFKPAYNEDLDYHWRIHLAGFEAAHYEAARFYHYGSATIKLDEKRREQNGESHTRNDFYFTQKWGRKPDTCCDEDYTGLYPYPYNNPDHPILGREHRGDHQPGLFDQLRARLAGGAA